MDPMASDTATIKMEEEEASESRAMKRCISCQLCGKEFSQMDKLSYHIYNNCRDEVEQNASHSARSESSDQQEITEVVVKKENGSDSMEDMPGSQGNDAFGGHVCDLCGKRFHKLQNLQVHVRSHTGEKPYCCQHCDKTFSSYGNLKAHSRVHTGLRPHQCSVCSKEFGTAQNLQVHFRTHTGEKPYKCDVCGKGFAGQGNLKVHQRTHTGEKPYKCQLCGKDFRNLQSLHIHVRSHTGEKPFECNVCHKSFSSQGNMQVHMRVHTGERPFHCDYCEKNFTNMQALKLHIRTHTGEKPHVCQVCGKDFASMGNLQVHMRSHTGTRPFSCRMCGKDFTTMSNMQVHMVRTHAGELYAENALLWSKMQLLSRQYMQMAGKPPEESLDRANPYPMPLNPGLPMNLPFGTDHLPSQHIISKSAAASVSEAVRNAVSTEQEETSGSLTKDTLSDSEEETKHSIERQSNEKNFNVKSNTEHATAVKLKSEPTSGDAESKPVGNGVDKPSVSESSDIETGSVKDVNSEVSKDSSISSYDKLVSSSDDNIFANTDFFSRPEPSADSAMSSSNPSHPSQGANSANMAASIANTPSFMNNASIPEMSSPRNSASAMMAQASSKLFTTGSSMTSTAAEVKATQETSNTCFVNSFLNESNFSRSKGGMSESVTMQVENPFQDYLTAQRSMIYGNQMPDMSQFGVQNHTMLKMADMFGTKQSTYPKQRDMFNLMNSSHLLPNPDQMANDILNYNHPSNLDYNFQATRSAMNPFANETIKSELGQGDLNSIVQSALNMYMPERGEQYAPVERKDNPRDKSPFGGSGGPVFPTNI